MGAGPETVLRNGDRVGQSDAYGRTARMRFPVAHRLLIIVFIAVAAICRGAVADAPPYVVVIGYHVTNTGKTPIESAIVSCRVPASNRYQQIFDTVIAPTATESEKDSLSQTLALVDLGTLAPGQTKGVQILCWVKSKTAVLTPPRDKAGKEPFSNEEKTAYLEDAPPFGLPDVRKTATDVAARATSPMGKAKAIFDYITTTFEYDMRDRDHLDAAPTVIARKEGSCSELAFAFVALCRAVGVPARIVTSFRNREGATPSVDWPGHRWAEFYVDGVGWVPADPTNQINAFGKKSYWARQDPDYVALIDDGSSEPVSPRWEAVVAFYKPADSQVATKRFAVWRMSRDMQKERAFFGEGRKILEMGKPEDRIAAFDAWQQRKEPLRGAFALEAMYDLDVSVRRRAAKALDDDDDPTLTLPMLKIHSAETDDGVKTLLIQAIKSSLANKNDKYREIALANIIKSRMETAISPAVELVNDKSVAIRWRLAATLVKLGDKPGVNDAYATLLDDPEEMVRFQAAKQWSRLGSWTAAERLVKYLGSPDPARRTSALQALRGRADTDFDFKPLTSPGSPANQAARERWDRWVGQRGKP